jgi:hypothetical protein
MKKNIENFLCKIKILTSNISIINDNFSLEGNIINFKKFIQSFIYPPLQWYSLDSTELDLIIKLFQELSDLLISIITCYICELLSNITKLNVLLSYEINRINITVIEISYETNDELNKIYHDILNGLNQINYDDCILMDSSSSTQQQQQQPIIYYIPPFYQEEQKCDNNYKCKIFKIIFTRPFELVRKIDLNKIMKLNKTIKVILYDEQQCIKLQNFYNNIFMIGNNNNENFFFIIDKKISIYNDFFCNTFFYDDKLNIKILILQKRYIYS